MCGSDELFKCLFPNDGHSPNYGKADTLLAQKKVRVDHLYPMTNDFFTHGTLLYFACNDKNEEKIKYLISRGANKDILLPHKTRDVTHTPMTVRQYICEGRYTSSTIVPTSVRSLEETVNYGLAETMRYRNNIVALSALYSGAEYLRNKPEYASQLFDDLFPKCGEEPNYKHADTLFALGFDPNQRYTVDFEGHLLSLYEIARNDGRDDKMTYLLSRGAMLNSRS
jgi:hypothetical protein